MKYESLTGSSITQACQQLETYLASHRQDKKEVLRLVLIVEELLLRFQTQFGEQKSFHLSCGKQWGQDSFTLSLLGESFDPFYDEEDETSFIFRNLLNSLGLTPVWSYRNRRNIVFFSLSKRSMSPLTSLLIAAAAACVLGVLGAFIPSDITSATMEYVTPFFDSFMGVLSAISGPLVFLSVAWSICSIGDIATLGKLGKAVASRFFSMTYLLLLLGAALVTPFFSLVYSTEGTTGNSIIALCEMFLDIIPSNLVQPFVDNNLLQIIFLAVVFGTAILMLGKKLQVLSNVIADGNTIILQVMRWVNLLLPAFVFISLWKTFWTSGASEVALYSKPLIIYFVGIFLFMLFYVLNACYRCKISVVAFVKALLPSYLIAASTASSSAAFSTNVEVCEHKLGIHNKVTSFGIPLGQVVYMPCCALLFYIISLSAASTYGISVTPIWMLMCFIISGVLSIATPPIPNGPVVCFGILFLQLGIPDEAITMAVILNALTTNICVASNLLCRQCDLLITAKKLNMIDDKALQAHCGKKHTHRA